MRILLILFLFCTCASSLQAEGLTLDAFLTNIQQRYPAFAGLQKEASAQRAEEEGSKAVTDWRIEGNAGYFRQDVVDPVVFAPEEMSEYDLNAELSRKVIETGGEVGIAVQNFKQERTFGALPGNGSDIPANNFFPNQFYRGGAFVTYDQPLIQNRGGMLTRLPIDRARLRSAETKIKTEEDAESLLLDFARLYIRYAVAERKLAILKERVKLNNEQLEQMQRKAKAGVVNNADVLRSEQDFWASKQALEEGMAVHAARKAELLVLLRQRPDGALHSDYALYQVPKIPKLPGDKEFSRIRTIKRLLRAKELITLEKKAAEEDSKHDLTLEMRAGLQGGADNRGDAYNYNEPEVYAGVRYTRVFGEREQKAKAEAARLREAKAEKDIQSEKIRLRSRMESIIGTLRYLQQAIASVTQQKKAAARQTTEEQSLYRQGRGELNFVIASRDREQTARLRHADLAGSYHEHLLEFRELNDTLWQKDGNG